MCLEVVLAKSRGSVAWVMHCSRLQRGGESWQYMGEGFAGSWGAKGMKNKGEKEKRTCLSGNGRKCDVFEDRAVASMRLCLGGTSPCVRCVFFCCFARKRRRGRRKRVFATCFFTVFAYQKRQNLPVCVAFGCRDFAGNSSGFCSEALCLIMCLLGCAGKRSFLLFGVIAIVYKLGPPR